MFIRDIEIVSYCAGGLLSGLRIVMNAHNTLTLSLIDHRNEDLDPDRIGTSSALKGHNLISVHLSHVQLSLANGFREITGLIKHREI